MCFVAVVYLLLLHYVCNCTLCFHVYIIYNPLCCLFVVVVCVPVSACVYVHIQ